MFFLNFLILITIFKVFEGTKIFVCERDKGIFFKILSIRSNGDQMNALILILHLIPISIPPSMEFNCAMAKALQRCNSIFVLPMVTLYCIPSKENWHEKI